MDTQYLLKKCDFWTVGLKNGASWYWRKLLNLRTLLNVDTLKPVTLAGKYYSSKCYDDISGPNTVMAGYRQIWCRLAAPKHRFMFWLTAQRKLLTRDRLINYLPDIEVSCPICGYNFN